MTGLYYEECEPGLVFDHAIRRTVTETDNTLFCALTLNTAAVHLDEEYAKGTVFGQRLVNSLYLLGLVTGISVPETTQGTTLANLGFEDVRFPKPVFHGDTIHVRTEILDRRISSSRTDSGIVRWRHFGMNQRDEIVCDCRRVALMYYREPQPVTAGGG
ncbi:MaoC family dehydratase [Sporichthya sp.]|uniref:MaoC family dehydratase n=1 Tax=Sporichthya sp. TaxID=65475 RepID=UPI0018547562|nr:MaoC family dehydratase [Sporichthya sp.]MBA3741430.1 MaoC family dehydratase [Sporichthya sp.]